MKYILTLLVLIAVNVGASERAIEIDDSGIITNTIKIDWSNCAIAATNIMSTWAVEYHNITIPDDFSKKIFIKGDISTHTYVVTNGYLELIESITK